MFKWHFSAKQMFRTAHHLLEVGGITMHKCKSYGPDKLNIWPFWPSTYLKKMFQMALLLLEGNNCAKSFWNPCINVQLWPGQAPYMYMTILTFIWPLWPRPSTHLKMFQMAFLLLKGNNCAKLFWNPLFIVQVMVWTNPDGCTDARTHTHRTKIVITMSRLPASRDEVLVLVLVFVLTRAPFFQYF